jgi:hypothetical protein
MSKISIASFSSSNWYSFGHSLTIRIWGTLVTSPISGTWMLFQFHVFHLPNMHYVFISYSSLLNALVVHFISAIFVQFISKSVLFNKLCYFFLLVTFLRHKFYYLLELLT